LKASVGFGGSCFRKDILNLVYIAESYGLYDVARYWESVVLMNEYQEGRFADRMVKLMFNTVAGKRIALFGFAFKVDTGDTREAPAITIAKKLFAVRAEFVVTDPNALDNAQKDLAGHPVAFESDPYEAAKGAHAIAILTGWQEYADLDYKKIFASMEKPAFVFDGCDCVDVDTLYDIGFNVIPLGKPVRADDI